MVDGFIDIFYDSLLEISYDLYLDKIRKRYERPNRHTWCQLRNISPVTDQSMITALFWRRNEFVVGSYRVYIQMVHSCP